MVTQDEIDILIDVYFNQLQILYAHLFDSYNVFIKNIIPKSIKKNYFYENIDKDKIYMHGLECTDIRIKPSTFENDIEIKFPSDARKNQLNYFGTIIANITQFVEIIDLITGNKIVKIIGEIEKDISIANIPIMVKSEFCTTYIKKDYKNECKYDPGGYFIVNGNEKVVMSMEKMADNKIFIFTKKDVSYNDGLIYIAQINSREDECSDNLQIFTIKNKKDNVLTVTISSQLIDIPLFVLLRALGIESDLQIISYITNNLEDNKMLNLLRPSISMINNDSETGEIIKSKDSAIDYLITKLKKNKRINNIDENIANIQKKMLLEKIFKQDLLPHLGEDINKKIVFISIMTNKFLNVMLGRRDIDDRDALENKRIETPGILLGQLFRQNWRKMLNEIGKNFKKKNQSDENPLIIINQIKPSIIEHGLKTALSTGRWGINKTKHGVAQALQRLSYFQTVSYFRRILSPSLEEATSKVTSIRHANPKQIHMICCAETPEGQKIGIVKSLAMMATITTHNSSQYDIIKNILKYDSIISHPYDIEPLEMNSHIKIFLNGDLYAMCHLKNGKIIINKLKEHRRNGIIDMHTTILFDISNKEIRVFFDGGRLIRPLLIVNNNKLNLDKEIIDTIESQKNNKTKLWKLILNKYNNLIEYEDIESTNYLLIAENLIKLNENSEISDKKVEYKESMSKINRYGDFRWVNYTHCEFHGWLSMGTVVANIPFSDHNYGTRNILHFSHARQAMGIFSTAYKDRMDISQILYNPQIPLTPTKAMQYNGMLDMPYGENVIIAFCSYEGYNQEDSIIINKSAIERGLFSADTLKKYHSEILKNHSTSQDDIFTKPDRNKVANMKHGNYDKLNDKGYVSEETSIQHEDMIIGKISPIQPTNTNKMYKDNSEMYKLLVPGVIDRVHTGIFNSERYEMYNIRVRMFREPLIGDKFSNFHAGKGTVGIILPQKDMPFSESGMIPDIIINPHSYPKRMAMGHFIECISAKIAALTGKFIDGTPFNNFDVKSLPEALEKLGFSSHGTEKLYSGITGQPMESEIFFTPSYFLRIRHMVQDKVHARARGPRQSLTRQPLEGRSRDGGLKIGEMEKDAIIAHGMGQFLKERLMETSDITLIHVCDYCGLPAFKAIDKDYYKCNGCKNSINISAVSIPYAFKLLSQELMTVNIMPQIITKNFIETDKTI
jgi:DNA-directed RNA polymerase II subunit RPB2